MNIKALCLGATFALSTFGGQAMAGVLNDPDTMKPFFTDSSMKTMKPTEPFRRHFFAVSF